MQKVEKVKVLLSQKINLGNYETRDLSVELEMTSDEVPQTIDWAKKYLEKVVLGYYDEVKGAKENEQKKIEEEKRKDEAIFDLIKKMSSKEDRAAIEELIKKIPKEEVRKLAIRDLNIKILQSNGKL